MGKIDRLREEGMTEEEIAEELGLDEGLQERPQDPETARSTVPEPDNGLDPYEPPPRDAGEDAGVEAKQEYEADDEGDDEDLLED